MAASETYETRDARWAARIEALNPINQRIEDRNTRNRKEDALPGRWFSVSVDSKQFRCLSSLHVSIRVLRDRPRGRL